MHEDIVRAIEHSNLDLVKKLIPPNFEVNELAPSGMRYIDYAAGVGNLASIQWLVEDYQADLSFNPAFPLTNLFFWITLCVDISKRKRIFEWLAENKRYEQLRCGITSQHINAVLGETLGEEWQDNLDDTGLPVSYYAVAGNVKITIEEKAAFILKNLSTSNLLKEGFFKGASIIWLLAYSKKFNLLEKVLEQQEVTHIDLNVSPVAEKNMHKGITLAWLLTFSKKWELLKKLLEQPGLTFIDLNVKPEALNDPYKGITLTWLLAASEQWGLLEKLLKLHGEASIDLNARWEAPKDPTTTVAWQLVKHKQWLLLEKLIKRADAIDLNAKLVAAENTLEQDITVAWMLANYQQWSVFGKLLKQQASAAFLDLNAKPANPGHHENGCTLAWMLIDHIKNNKKHQFFKKILIQNKDQIRLDVSCAIKASTAENYNRYDRYNIVDSLIEYKQEELLLEIMLNANPGHPIPVENTKAIQKLCKYCSFNRPEKLIEFLQKYTENDINTLLNTEATKAFIFFYIIDRNYKGFSSVETLSISTFKENKENLSDIFGLFQRLELDQLKQQSVQKLWGMLCLLKEVYKNAPVEVENLLTEYPHILNFTNKSSATLHSPKELPTLEKINFEISMLLQGTPEFESHMAEMHGERSRLQLASTSESAFNNKRKGQFSETFQKSTFFNQKDGSSESTRKKQKTGVADSDRGLNRN